MTSRPTVTIRQGTLRGTVLKEGLPRPLEAFLGVRYALPPTGERRFRPPEPVEASTEVFDVTEYGPRSWGKLLTKTPGLAMDESEDCLTANVFRQVDERSPASAASRKLLPVAVYIHGGAFNRGSASSHNTPSMLAYSTVPFVAVSFNYRLGALGFLPSAQSAAEGALNVGLKDQVLLLEWVQENIAAFGGDPSDVAIFGLSAGAHSVGHHLFHYKDGVAPLFRRAALESGATTSRAVRPFDAPIHEAQFADFLHEAGVPPTLPKSETFAFLRTLPAETIAQAQETVFEKYNPSLRWAFQPVVDGDLIARAPIESWKMGRWHKVPILTGFNGNEGSMYVDKTLATAAGFRSFWHELLPLLTDEDLDQIEARYPDPDTVPDSIYKETRPGDCGLGSQYKRVEAAYGNYAYVAPVRQTAELAAPQQEAPVFLYHWTLVSSLVEGAAHASNVPYECRDPTVVGKTSSLDELAGFLHAYMVSFLATGDPSAVAGAFPQRPQWPRYTVGGGEADGRVIRFAEGNEELIGGSAGTTAQCVRDTWAREDSEYWWSKVEASQH